MLNAPTLTLIGLLIVGCALSAPVLFRGFGRRGKGVFYEQNFLIQRAPQMATLANVVVIVAAFFAFNNLLLPEAFQPLVTLSGILPASIAYLVSWLGVLIFMSGLVFMIGGWYSLGDCFSTDAEVLDGHTVRRTGMLKYVMHPAYSGIIQCCLGASLTAVSLQAALVSLAVVAPLWLRRAKYEETLLLQTLGTDYEKYGQDLKWRRLVPAFFPIGV
jgi:protein-S-isoprenylcysteine O-methyltransferase Ste14